MKHFDHLASALAAKAFAYAEGRRFDDALVAAGEALCYSNPKVKSSLPKRLVPNHLGPECRPGLWTGSRIDDYFEHLNAAVLHWKHGIEDLSVA